MMSASADLSRAIVVMSEDSDVHATIRQSLANMNVGTRIDSRYAVGEVMRYLQDCGEGKVSWPVLLMLDYPKGSEDCLGLLRWMRQQDILEKTVIALFSPVISGRDYPQAFTLGSHTILVNPLQPARLLSVVIAAERISRTDLSGPKVPNEERPPGS